MASVATQRGDEYGSYLPGGRYVLVFEGGILAAPASVPLVLLGAVCVAMLGPALGAAEHLTVTSFPPG